MGRKQHTSEPFLWQLREAEVELLKGLKVLQVWMTPAVTEQTDYCWSKVYGGLQFDEAKPLKDLERASRRIKKMLVEATLLLLCCRPDDSTARPHSSLGCRPQVLQT